MLVGMARKNIEWNEIKRIEIQMNYSEVLKLFGLMELGRNDTKCFPYDYLIRLKSK